MNNIERRKREKKRKGKFSNSEFSISKPKNMNFSPPFPSVNEFANLDNLSIDRGKKKKERKSWRVASPDTISLFSFDVAPLYTRRIKIEIDRCDRRCLNSLKKIRVTRHVEIENLNLYGFEEGREGKGRRGGAKSGKSISYNCLKMPNKGGCCAIVKRINYYSALDWFRVYFY